LCRRQCFYQCSAPAVCIWRRLPPQVVSCEVIAHCDVTTRSREQNTGKGCRSKEQTFCPYIDAIPYRKVFRCDFWTQWDLYFVTHHLFLPWTVFDKADEVIIEIHVM
jgi:hypothetical protein